MLGQSPIPAVEHEQSIDHRLRRLAPEDLLNQPHRVRDITIRHVVLGACLAMQGERRSALEGLQVSTSVGVQSLGEQPPHGPSRRAVAEGTKPPVRPRAPNWQQRGVVLAAPGSQLVELGAQVVVEDEHHQAAPPMVGIRRDHFGQPRHDRAWDANAHVAQLAAARRDERAEAVGRRGFARLDRHRARRYMNDEMAIGQTPEREVHDRGRQLVGKGTYDLFLRSAAVDQRRDKGVRAAVQDHVAPRAEDERLLVGDDVGPVTRRESGNKWSAPGWPSTGFVLHHRVGFGRLVGGQVFQGSLGASGSTK